ncbi:MAG: exodeoxyribonuclease VII small subunit [Alphaproteobacteria bacterium]|nr:exodeoxyribonuclease VII small subunit [Alphaproteobacteria bacterium]MBQ7284762.1 exodeoxyribonuclease VII small subunit [Alphaproteobacteria bacterium]
MDINEIKDLSFEEALAQLENIVRELESGRIKLDDAVNAYEKAVTLKQLCENKLQNAQLKIEKIEISPQGSVSTSEFTIPEA